jgi:predicted ribosomally synthesized peptide with SipW-like signal peptide
MKKILISLSVIGVAAAAIIGGTIAYYSDMETSTGNVFAAGAIDLKIDNTSYITDPTTGKLVRNDETSWDTPSDLTNQLFFNFRDLKPGDMGEDTVSLHVNDNDAWACVTMNLTKNDDVDCTAPELKDDPNCVEDNNDDFDGELAQNLNFIFWADDGDNVLEQDEPILMQGPAIDVLGGKTYTIADSESSIIPDKAPLKGGETYYIGKAWCFGELTTAPVEQGGNNSPLDNPGVLCNGAPVNNASQTDETMGDIIFYAEQARNNPDFVCSPPGPVTKVADLENKDSGWNIIVDEIHGTMTYSSNDTTFHGTVVAQGLTPNARYQISLTGQGSCTPTDDLLASVSPGDLFESGYWNGGPNLESTCGDPGQGTYNMDLTDDWYTVIAENDGTINYPFNLDMPAGTYSNVKVAVKKMLDTKTSPWVDEGAVHVNNLFETEPLSFTVINP